MQFVMEKQENKMKNLSGSFKLTDKIKDIAREVDYGSVNVELTVSRGKIVKAIIVEKQRVVLL